MSRGADVTGTVDDVFRGPRLMDKAMWLLQSYERRAAPDPASLLTELQAEIDAAREKSQEKGHAEAMQVIAARLSIPLEQARGA